MSQPPFGQPPGHPQPQQPPPGGYPQQGWGQQPPQGGGGRSNTALIVILVVLLLAGGGLGVFFLTQDDDEEGEGGGGGGGGGGEASAEEQEYIDALAASFDADDAADMQQLGLAAEDAPCMAEGMVRSIGVENIPYTPEEVRQGAADGWDPPLSTEQAETYYDVLSDCGADWRAAFLAELPGEGLTESQVECVDQSLSDDTLRDVMVAELTGDETQIDATREAMRAEIAQCQNA